MSPLSMSGRHGRVPAQTITLLERTVAQVRDEIVSALPAGASTATRADTAEIVLEFVLRDWREHDNTTGLLPADVEDLRNFVALAASLAGGDLGGRGRPVYVALLRGLLGDWLANWNAPGDPGPPGDED
ncbi:MAG: hypothetical protein IT340_04745 [Chloroflexi bacterium]|nr:hypothetical protein [Chloroflexota bacterium]